MIGRGATSTAHSEFINLKDKTESFSNAMEVDDVRTDLETATQGTTHTAPVTANFQMSELAMIGKKRPYGLNEDLKEDSFVHMKCSLKRQRLQEEQPAMQL